MKSTFRQKDSLRDSADAASVGVAMSKLPGDVTQLLKKWSTGDLDAQERLMTLVYNDLRNLARKSFKTERSDHTLQPTAVVHEMWLLINDRQDLDFSDRRKFYAFASKIMRFMLIDHARKKASERHGGRVGMISISEFSDLEEPRQIEPATLIALNDALDRLEEKDPRPAEIAILRYFSGLAIKEIVEILDISAATVKREWTVARLWLARELANSGSLE